MVSSGEEPEIDREFLEAQAERDYLRRNPALAERYAREKDHEKLLKEKPYLKSPDYEEWGREHYQELQLTHKPKGNKLYARKINHVKPAVNDDRDLTEDEYESPKPRESFCTKLSRKLGLCGGTRKRSKKSKKSKRSRK